MIWPSLLGAWAVHALGPAIFLRRGPSAEYGRPTLALTFDDGPDPRYTPRVLDILARQNLRATFFVVGSKVRRHPHLVRAAAAAGHDMGNHSDTHTPPWLQTPVWAYRDTQRANQSIAEAIGQTPLFARAPWGMPNLGQWLAYARSGQVHVHWTVHGFDWSPGITEAEIRWRVGRQARPGGVVLLHDGAGYPGNPDAMIRALPRMIEELQEQFRLVPLRELLPKTGPVRENEPYVDSTGLGPL